MQQKITQIVNNPYLSTKTLKKLRKLKEKKREELLKDKDFIALNVDKAGVWPEIVKVSGGLHCAERDIGIESAFKRRELEFQQEREHLFESANRWEIYREKRKEYTKLVRQIFFEKLRYGGLVTLFMQAKIIRVIKDNIRRKKEQKLLAKRVHKSIKLMQNSFALLIKRKGQIRQRRIRNQLRYALTFIVNNNYSDERLKASKIVYGLLKDFKESYDIRQKFLRFRYKMLKIQRIMRKQIVWNKNRMQLLKEYFNEVKNGMIVYLIKKQSQNSLVQKLRKILDEKRNLLLQSYLYKCRQKHCATFFEWRRNKKQGIMNSPLLIDSAKKSFLSHSNQKGNAQQQKDKKLIYSFSEVDISENLNIQNNEQVIQFNKVINLCHNALEKDLVNKQTSKQGEVNDNINTSSFFMTNVQVKEEVLSQFNAYQIKRDNDEQYRYEEQYFKFKPDLKLMMMLVLKATTLSIDDLFIIL